MGEGNSRRIVPDLNAEDELDAEKKDMLEDSHDDMSRMKKVYMDNFKDGCFDWSES